MSPLNGSDLRGRKWGDITAPSPRLAAKERPHITPSTSGLSHRGVDVLHSLHSGKPGSPRPWLEAAAFTDTEGRSPSPGEERIGSWLLRGIQFCCGQELPPLLLMKCL